MLDALLASELVGDGDCERDTETMSEIVALVTDDVDEDELISEDVKDCEVITLLLLAIELLERSQDDLDEVLRIEELEGSGRSEAEDSEADLDVVVYALTIELSCTKLFVEDSTSNSDDLVPCVVELDFV